MRLVFYNCLFGDKHFRETNDKIIYSYLVYKSLVTIDGVFQNQDNAFDFEVISDFWSYNNYTEVYRFSYSKAASDLKMSVNTIKSRMKVLQQIGAIRFNGDYLLVGYTSGIKSSKYFDLLIDTNLKGEKLIVYSYLKYKSKSYNNIITTFDKTQAEEFAISKKHYQKILCELYNDKLIERLPDGRLKIN